MDNDKLHIQLGKNIRKLRQKKGLSQVQLSKEIDIDRTCLIRIEQGITNLRFSSLIKISQGLGVKISELVKNI